MNEPGLAAAFAAGLLSFASPCVLPLVPAYLSYISGTSAADRSAGDGRVRRKVLSASLFFSAGFTVAFTALGILFSGAALFVGQGGYPAFLGVAGGLIIVALGLNMAFDFLKFLNADTRLLGKLAARRLPPGQGSAPRSTARAANGAGAFVLGLAFAAGWSPCIGPILASILIFAAREGAALRAGGLLAAYSVGFALPFVAAALFFDALKPVLDFLKRRGREVRIASGLLLCLFGALMAAGSLGDLSSAAARAGDSLRSFASGSPGLARAADIAFIALCALPALAGFSGSRRADGGRRTPGAGRIAWLALMAILAALELSGIVSLSGLAGSWLGYTGI